MARSHCLYVLLAIICFTFASASPSLLGHNSISRDQAWTADNQTYQLNNSYISVAFTVYGESISLTSLQLNSSMGLFGSGFHEFAYQDTSITALRSSSGIFLANETWVLPHVSNQTIIFANSSVLQVQNLQYGYPAFAFEDWRIQLAGPSVTWAVDRTFISSVDILADRLPAIVLDSYAGGIPSFLDLEIFINGTGGFLMFDRYAHLGEVLSPNQHQTLQLSPQGLALDLAIDVGFFSFAKMPVDGTGPVTIFGAETIDRRNETVQMTSPSTSQSQTLTLTLTGAAKPLSTLDLQLPDPAMDLLSQKFAILHNMWMGYFFGNNPCSATCLHEIGFFGIIQGMFVENSPTQQALAMQLKFMLNTSVTPSSGAVGNHNKPGFVIPRWDITGYYMCVWGPLHDQIPHMILAAYYQVLATGDVQWLQSVMPDVDLVAQYMLSCDSDGSSLLSVPGASGLSDGGKHSSNWYDIILFGNKDAYINIYCVMALNAMSEMKALLNDSTSAEAYADLYKRWSAAFNKHFWLADEGIYADWIDVDNQVHSYFYTDQNLLAIITGVANDTQTSQIITALDKSYANLLGAFGVNRDTQLYATPSNMWPITVDGDMVFNGTLADQKDFPHYENGLSFFHSTGYEIAARAVAGDPDGAYETFERVMNNGFAVNQFWGAAADWVNGTLSSEPLNNSLLTLWGMLRGCFGVWPNLRTIEVIGRPSSQLEGATYSFAYMGKRVTLTVQNGKTIIS